MEIFDYNERERIKRESNADSNEWMVERMRWHRFLDFIHDKHYVPDHKVAIKFEVYERLRQQYPGWSNGFLTPTHCSWRPEYYNTDLLMNIAIINAVGLKRALNGASDPAWLLIWLKSRGYKVRKNKIVAPRK